MQIQSINLSNFKNYSAQKTMNSTMQVASQPMNYKISTLDALSFMGNGMYTDAQICSKLIKDAKIKTEKSSSWVKRFNKQEEIALKKAFRDFKTEKGMKKSYILNALLNIRNIETHGEELMAEDIINYTKVASGRTKEEQIALVNILEAEMRSGVSDGTEERMSIIFAPIRKYPEQLKTLSKLNKYLEEKGMDSSLKNDILWWVQEFIGKDKPYIENYYKQISNKLENSNLELAPAISELCRICDANGFRRILPILNLENKDEFMNNGNFSSLLRWRRQEAVNEFVKKYSK